MSDLPIVVLLLGVVTLAVSVLSLAATATEGLLLDCEPELPVADCTKLDKPRCASFSSEGLKVSEEYEALIRRQGRCAPPQLG